MPRVNKQAGRVARRGNRARVAKTDKRDERSVLLVENSASVAQMVGTYLRERCNRESHWAKTLAQARALLKEHAGDDMLAAVVNLELPDASDEEIVALTLSYGVPTVVLTGTFSEVKRRRILRHDIVDYCLKGKSGIESLVHVIERLQRNPELKVLLVDDTAGSRAQQLALLNAQRFEVLQAQTVDQALALYHDNPDVLLVTIALGSDQKAHALISELREQASPDRLAIIALSAAETAHTPAQYLKAGASDFLAKPFEKEEYLCRVYGCVDRALSMRRIRQLAFNDGLTGVANRMAFFREVPSQLEDALRRRQKPGIALLSIDQLSEINEDHGYQVGDEVLRHIARTLQSQLGPDAFIARFGGQQFSVFVRDAPPATLGKLFERVRASIERGTFTHEGRNLPLTMSCGAIACEVDEPIDTYVNRADTALDDAEHEGNCVVLRG